MGLVKKYVFYKRALQTLFALNVFFIVAGVVACVHYFRTHDVSSLELVVVGAGTLVFGILTPAFLIGRLVRVAQDLRRQTEEKVAKWVAGWLEEYREHSGDGGMTEAISDPRFWMNIVLLSVEIFGQNSKHPVGQYLAEFAPVIKEQLAKQSPPPRRKSRKRAKSADTRAA